MANVNGTIVIGFSENFEGDKEAICEVMNQSDHWATCGTSMKYNGAAIYMGSSDCVDPTLCNRRPTHIMVNKKGIEQVVAEDEATDEDWDNYIGECDTSVSYIMTEFAPDVSNHIQAGSMFMTQVSKEKMYDAYFEMLEVRANGSGSLTRISHSTNGSPEIETINF